jgi:hypothetical protein
MPDPKPYSKTHDALLYLARNPDDYDAMLTVYQENREAIRAAFRRWIGGRNYRNFVEVGLMVHVCRMASLFDPVGLTKSRNSRIRDLSRVTARRGI